MRIGICTSIDNYYKVEHFGFDYLEGSVSEIAGLSSEQFSLLAEKVMAGRMKCAAFNMLFPNNIMIVGGEADIDQISEYASHALQRVNMLGGKIVVFGSGKSRNCPEQWDYEKAWEQLVSVSRILGKEASKNGITVAIEPLNRGNCNMINTIPAGIKLVEEVDHPNVKLLADFYHMRIENEKMDALLQAGPMLKHLHIANSFDRKYPLHAGEDIYEEFFDMLVLAGYKGDISIEARTNQFDIDAPASLDFLRDILKRKFRI
jgi:D-psicose/D-tagatose/L-ribulose 3-epimerase